jgi:hypothetical protein
MSVYIRGQRFSALACTFHRFKIIYKSNIKESLVSIYCNINTGSCRALEKSEKHLFLSQGRRSRGRLRQIKNINKTWFKDQVKTNIKGKTAIFIVIDKI